MGYGKFKPYLQRLFHSVEVMITQEETEFKKIDAKYQYVIFQSILFLQKPFYYSRDMVRQCHIYENTLSMLKEVSLIIFQLLFYMLMLFFSLE